MSNLANILELRQTPDSARTYKWDLIIEGGGLEDPSQNRFNIRCESADLPQPAHSVIDVNIRGFTRKEAGAIEWNPLTFTIVETDDYDLSQALYDLKNRQFNYTTGVQEPKASVETTMTLQLLSVEDTVVKSWRMIGGVIENLVPPQLNNDKAGFWTGMTFTLHYDYAELVGGGSGGG